jgi:hypothetical protein
VPTIITASDLRAVLGVSPSLYSDDYLNQILLSAEQVILPMLEELESGDYSDTEAVQSAIYVVATEIFQSRTAAGGQIEGVDFAPTPYRMGKSLMSRVSGLLAPYLDEGAICQ